MIKKKLVKFGSFALAAAMGLSMTAGSFAAAELPFTDVTKAQWFYKEVQAAYEKGLMNGMGADEFAPEGTLNRAMFAAILYRMDGSKVTASDKFSDVPSDKWYSEAVTWAADSGVTSGTSETTFSPDQSITREQICTMLHRYANYKQYDASATTDLASKFNDAASVSTYAKEGVSWCVADGIMKGSDGSILPQNDTKRSEAAALVNRFDDKYTDNAATVDQQYKEAFDAVNNILSDPDKPLLSGPVEVLNRLVDMKNMEYSGARAQLGGGVSDVHCVDNMTLAFRVNLDHYNPAKWRERHKIWFRMFKDGEIVNNAAVNSDMVTFTNSNPDVINIEFVTQDNNGFDVAEYARFTPVGYGTTTITCTPKDGSAPATITVKILPHTCSFPTVEEVKSWAGEDPEDACIVSCKGDGCDIVYKAKDFIANNGNVDGLTPLPIENY